MWLIVTCRKIKSEGPVKCFSFVSSRIWKNRSWFTLHSAVKNRHPEDFTLQAEKGNAETPWAFLHRCQKMDMSMLFFCTLNCLDSIQVPEWVKPKLRTTLPEVCSFWASLCLAKLENKEMEMGWDLPTVLLANGTVIDSSKEGTHSCFHHLRNSFCFDFWDLLQSLG